MSNSKKPSGPMSAKEALDNAMNTLPSANLAKHLPKNPLADVLETQGKLEKLMAAPVDHVAEEIAKFAKHVPADTSDAFQESTNKHMAQLAQTHAAQDRHLDDKIRRIVREELEKWVKEQVQKPRLDSKEGV